MTPGEVVSIVCAFFGLGLGLGVMGQVVREGWKR